MKEKLEIKNIQFEIRTHLGTKTLLCTEPSFESVNTLIGLISDDSGFIEKLLTLGTFAVQGFSVMKITDTDTAKKGKEFWAHHSKETLASEDIFSVKALNFSTVYVSATFLSSLDSEVKNLQRISKPTDPPWLFRASSLAPYPCRLPALEPFERSLLQNFETELAAYLLNNNLNFIQERFHDRLQSLGLRSTQYQEEKIRWLDIWACRNILVFYSGLANETVESNPD